MGDLRGRMNSDQKMYILLLGFLGDPHPQPLLHSVTGLKILKVFLFPLAQRDSFLIFTLIQIILFRSWSYVEGISIRFFSSGRLGFITCPLWQPSTWTFKDSAISQKSFKNKWIGKLLTLLFLVSLCFGLYGNILFILTSLSLHFYRFDMLSTPSFIWVWSKVSLYFPSLFFSSAPVVFSISSPLPFPFWLFY